MMLTCGAKLENGSKVMKNQPREKNISFDFLYDLMKMKNIAARINNDPITEKLRIEVSNFVLCSIVRLTGKNNKAM